MSQSKHPPKDDPTVSTRTTISFGLGRAVAKRPGLTKPTTTTSTDLSGKGMEATTASTDAMVVSEATPPLIIPLPNRAPIVPPSQLEKSPNWEKYDPHKIGLQIRRPLKVNDGDDSSLAPEGIRRDAAEGKQRTDTPPSFLKRCPFLDSGQTMKERTMEDTVAEVKPEAYAKVPVDQFGAALLRGMGWREGEGVGRRRQQRQGQNVKIIEPRMRPKGLGLGAAMRGEKSPSDDEEGGMKFAPNADPSHSPTINFAEAQPMVGVGSRVRVRRGAYAGTRGIVTKVLAGESQVRLMPSGAFLIMDHDDLQVLTDGQNRDEDQGFGNEPEVDESYGTRTMLSPVSPASLSSWLRPHIRVKFASSRSSRLAMHHGMQGDVLDVHQGLAIIRKSDGSLVTDVSANYLQPSLPAVGETVLVLAEGPFQGLKGVLLERDGLTAHVQLLDAEVDDGYYGEGEGPGPGNKASSPVPLPPHDVISMSLDSIAPCCI